MIYYIADLHFGHENVIGYDNRPFKSSFDMDEALIENWNSRVTSDDTVYVIGDAFWGKEERSIQIIKRLNGKKHLIEGNHDRINGQLAKYWQSISHYAEIIDGDKTVILCHYPLMFYKNQKYGTFMLYGHVHKRYSHMIEAWKKEQLSKGVPSGLFNVGCMIEYMNYTPRTLEEIVDGSKECFENN